MAAPLARAEHRHKAMQLAKREAAEVSWLPYSANEGQIGSARLGVKLGIARCPGVSACAPYDRKKGANWGMMIQPKATKDNLLNILVASCGIIFRQLGHPCFRSHSPTKMVLEETE